MIDIAPEHIHPLLVHFPVALWPTAFVLYVLSYFPKLSKLRSSAVLIGLIGSGLGYLALETGEEAAKIVGHSICDSKLLFEHSDQTRSAFIILSVTWALIFLYDILVRKVLKRAVIANWPGILFILGLVLGNTFLVVSAHKGFRLVYFQQAAIQREVPECKAKTKN